MMYRKYFPHLHSNLYQTIKFNSQDLLTQPNNPYIIVNRHSLNVEYDTLYMIDMIWESTVFKKVRYMWPNIGHM